MLLPLHAVIGVTDAAEQVFDVHGSPLVPYNLSPFTRTAP